MSLGASHCKCSFVSATLSLSVVLCSPEVARLVETSDRTRLLSLAAKRDALQQD